MKDWWAYIGECSNSELWGFVCLDYYNRLEGSDRPDPSAFIDLILTKVDITKVEPVMFHEVLVCVCVQLLGSDFDATLDHSLRFLGPHIQSLSADQLRTIISHYAAYGKTGLIVEGLGRLSPGNQRITLAANSHAEDKLKGDARSMAAKLTGPFLLFYSYAHEDEKMRNKLAAHLSLLKRERVIDDWHDRRIDAGMDFEKEIDEHLKMSTVVLLLVSAAFTKSDYCYGVEMKLALELHANRKAVVIPVILRHCDWKTAPFGKLNALPIDAVSVDDRKWKNQDQAFAEVAKGIRTAIEGIRTGGIR